MSGLSERDMRILAFERRGWRSPGVKEQAISDTLGIPATRYYQLLNELIDRPEALAFDPALVKRLRAQRARRQRIRSPPSKGRPRARGPPGGSPPAPGARGAGGRAGPAPPAAPPGAPPGRPRFRGAPAP